MSLLPKSGKHPEVSQILQVQLDLIKNKRTVQIKLSDFPSEISLGTICEVISEVLGLFSPPVHLERIILADNALTSLPTEFEMLCGVYMRYLDLHNNHFSTVPDIIGSCCPHLEGLDLSLNYLNSLERSVFFNLLDLKVLLIKNNEFNYLPPLLGEMINLEVIAVADNPLILPSIELVKSMPGGTNDLKAYLLSNSDTLEQHLQHQMQHAQKAPTTPSLTRTRSLSESRSKSLKASRRMGFIINSTKSTPEDVSTTQSAESNNQDIMTPSKPERKLLLPTTEKSDISLLDRKDSSFNLDMTPVPSTYTATTASPRSTSPSGVSSNGTLSRPGSRNRSRSNTLREINVMVDNNEPKDSEQKAGAHIRRLSTLQERPADESIRASQENFPIVASQKDDPTKRSHLASTQDVSPLKHTTRKTSFSNNVPSDANSGHLVTFSHPDGQGVHDPSVALKVARKVLFSFSEVHSSIKRFTGKSSDRKITLKVVPLLHTTKGNIDMLVETIEAAEDNVEDYEQIMNAILTCITSFKQLLVLISENLSSFSSRIDVCLIRMLYLTLYGSFNEMHNVYRLLNPLGAFMKSHPAIARNQSGIALTTLDSKLKQVHSAVTAEEFQASAIDLSNLLLESDPVSLEEIDEKLYQCIDLATLNAKTVFSELTMAISKSAIASANTNNAQTINLVVSNKFKELTNVCMTSMYITKRLALKSLTIRSNQSPQVRKLFWDDINLFLKAIIQTFSSVKAIMKDAPILNEVRQSMATLTKTTKDLTILLEASSYKSMSDSLISATQLQTSSNSVVLPLAGPPSLNSVHSSSAFNLPQLLGNVALVRTPLVATVGAAAAQAILPPSDAGHSVVSSTASNPPISFNIPPLVSSDVLNTGLHTAPVQSMEQYYAKNINPFDRI